MGIAEYFVGLAERAEPQLRGADQGYWCARLRSEHDNLRNALAWALGGAGAERGLRLVGALRTQLDEARFRAAWAEGRAMSLGEAVSYALGSVP